MANHEHFYFYAPTWDCPPDGPIKLGNVISSATKHDRALAHYPLDSSPGAVQSEKRNVQYTSEKLRSGRFSILTKWLSLLGLGIDAGYELSRRDGTDFTFERIETTQFIPQIDSLQTVIEADHVRRFLEISRYRKPVYVITGIKTVFGAEAQSAHQRRTSSALATEVDGTIWSGGTVPVSGGPGIEVAVSRDQSVAWKGSSDFVFAYRVSRVTVTKKRGLVLKEEEYRKGAMLGNEAHEAEKAELTITQVQDYDVVEEGCEAFKVLEDDERVTCASANKPSDQDD